MKKVYEKPTLVKRDQLQAITAQNIVCNVSPFFNNNINGVC